MSPSNRRQAQRLVDMGEVPPDETYQPPPESACDPVLAQVIDLDDDIRLFVANRIYRGRVVHFSIELCLIDNDTKHVVARIDTSHGTVHQHQYYRKSSGTKCEIARIPADGGWDFVHDQWESSYDTLVDQCDLWIERWRQ